VTHFGDREKPLVTLRRFDKSAKSKSDKHSAPTKESTTHLEDVDRSTRSQISINL